MPSGGCTVTPGKILAPKEKINNPKLNEGFQPVVRVNEGSIGTRELIPLDVQEIIGAQFGFNLFINGNMSYWRVPDDYGDTPPAGWGTGVVGSGRKHEYNAAARWAIANDANRIATRELFDPGQTDVPEQPGVFLRWQQTSAISGINPAYFGQRVNYAPFYSERTVTFTIWVRADTNIPVTPQVRQYFGDAASVPTPSADVITPGASVNLVADVWTKIKYSLIVPSTATKTVAGPGIIPASFTEFRIVVPQGIPFRIDFAQAQLIDGTEERRFDRRPFVIDWLMAQRYRQRVGMMLSDNLLTHGSPSVMLPVNPGVPLQPANIALIPYGGSGATVAASHHVRGLIIQTTANSTIAEAEIFVDQELHAPD